MAQQRRQLNHQDSRGLQPRTQRPVQAHEGTRQPQPQAKPTQNTQNVLAQLFSDPKTCALVSAVIAVLPFSLVLVFLLISIVSKGIGLACTWVASHSWFLIEWAARNVVGILIGVVLIAAGLWAMFTVRWIIERRQEAQERYEQEVLKKHGY